MANNVQSQLIPSSKMTVKFHTSVPDLALDRVQLIKATQNLGIDRKSLASFLKQAIETEEKHLSMIDGIVSDFEMYERKQGIKQADLIRLIYEYF